MRPSRSLARYLSRIACATIGESQYGRTKMRCAESLRGVWEQSEARVANQTQRGAKRRPVISLGEAGVQDEACCEIRCAPRRLGLRLGVGCVAVGAVGSYPIVGAGTGEMRMRDSGARLVTCVHERVVVDGERLRVRIRPCDGLR